MLLSNTSSRCLNKTGKGVTVNVVKIVEVRKRNGRRGLEL